MKTSIGFLGTGGIARWHAQMLRAAAADVRLRAFDIRPESLGSFAQLMGAEEASSEAQLIASCDGIFVCSWPSEHPRQVEAVASAGKGVFCEKPLAVNLNDAQAMLECVRAAGVKNQVGLVLRHFPEFVVMKDLVAQPESGRIRSVVSFNESPIDAHKPGSWRSKRELSGGGAVIETAFHDLDLVEWICGPIDGVQAQTQNAAGMPVEDAGQVLLSFADGALGTLGVVWNMSDKRCQGRSLQVVCDHATYTASGAALAIKSQGERQVLARDELTMMAQKFEPFTGCPPCAFVDAVSSEQDACPGFDVGVRAHLLVDAVYRSASSSGALVHVG